MKVLLLVFLMGSSFGNYAERQINEWLANQNFGPLAEYTVSSDKNNIVVVVEDGDTIYIKAVGTGGRKATSDEGSGLQSQNPESYNSWEAGEKAYAEEYPSEYGLARNLIDRLDKFYNTERRGTGTGPDTELFNEAKSFLLEYFPQVRAEILSKPRDEWDNVEKHRAVAVDRVFYKFVVATDKEPDMWGDYETIARAGYAGLTEDVITDMLESFGFNPSMQFKDMLRYAVKHNKTIEFNSLMQELNVDIDKI